MNDTQIKTRHGMILQGALASSLQEAGYEFVQDYQYSEICEIPDFLIPDGDSPRIIVETHQTDARNSFQMKTLRAFTAVTEAKAHYGNQIISVNVLFGDPENELPKNNVIAMCGIFDVNIIPRYEIDNLHHIASLEAASLELASDESIKTEEAIAKVVEQEATGISQIAQALKKYLSSAKPKRSLFPLWELERLRAQNLDLLPLTGNPTFYKRMMLKTLYLTDEDFKELVSKGDPDACSLSVKKQLVVTGLAEITEEIYGDHLTLDPLFEEYIRGSKAIRLRELCKVVLSETPEMHWFFEDIRVSERRLRMAEKFFQVLGTGENCISEAIMSNLKQENFLEIQHCKRCWFADLVARHLNISHNRMNNLIRNLNADPQNLGNPFNQLSYKSQRFMSNPSTHLQYANAVQRGYEMVRDNENPILATSPEILANRLLDLRLDGAIKLRKLDPLFLVALGAAKEAGLQVEPCRVQSIVSDLAGARSTGRFEAFSISEDKINKKILLANFIAVHDNNGDHKSKEWGARRLATLYRIIDGKIQHSEYQEAIFVLDGEWTDKDVARLYRSGWNHIVRLDDLEEKLREIFNIPIPSSKEDISIPEIELPIAAETYNPDNKHEIKYSSKKG